MQVADKKDFFLGEINRWKVYALNISTSLPACSDDKRKSIRPAKFFLGVTPSGAPVHAGENPFE